MTKILRSKDCGNSPKNQLLQDLTIAMAKADTSTARELVTGDIEWTPIGRQPVPGVDAFCRAFSRYGPATKLTIEHVISHGKSGAVNGVVEWGNNRRAFCHVYEFSNAKGTAVRSLTSYSIKLK